jgi:crotonobetainyl-CoA:carnitine CoA-transferase CaiB-like acyl-CoA transferase
MTNKILEGIRVVEIGVYQTGPLTAQALSNCGAEVIKIDTSSRLMGAGVGGPGLGIGAAQKATNKLSITLNFATPQGLALAHRLIAKTDVFIENLAGGTVTRRGLGYEQLKKIRPDLIMVSTCMQGQTGPYATHAASGHKLSALSGFNHISGWPDRPPAWIAAYTDNIAPCYNVIAILAALDYRRRTGKGQFLDISQNEPGVQFMGPLLLDYVANGRVASRMGNKYPYAAPHNAYRCRGEDRWCAISVFTDEEWRSFCKVIGDPGLSSDHRFSTLLARKENEEELDAIINEWTGSRYAEEVMALMQSAGVAAGVVQNAADQVTWDPQLRHRRFFSELDHPTLGKYLSPPGLHAVLSKTPQELRRAPLLGEHNEYVFKELIGMSDAEYNAAVEAKVID